MPHGYRVISGIDYAYFITCTVINWLPIFEHEAYRRIVLDSLAYIREHKQTQLNAYVMMPTHLHAGFRTPED